jgi:arabinose-5-phosphate isomerase
VLLPLAMQIDVAVERTVPFQDGELRVAVRDQPIQQSSTMVTPVNGDRDASPEPSGTASRSERVLLSGRRTLAIEAAALAAMAPAMGDSFCAAVELILGLPGRLIVAGSGKSGLVARKIAATLSSTGTPSLFLHPSDALHGDLGVVCPGDAVLLLSNSGENADLLTLLPFFQRRSVPLIALVGTESSALARRAGIVLHIASAPEACPMGLAPTTSTTLMTAMGDALAVALLEERGFTMNDFAERHPEGVLGRRLSLRVENLMIRAPLPLVEPEQSVGQVITCMTGGRLGLAVVVSEDRIQGLITDGDLRRAMERGEPFLHLRARDIMTAQPRWVRPDLLAADARHLLSLHRITSLLVSPDGRRLSGVVHVHQLIGALGEVDV